MTSDGLKITLAPISIRNASQALRRKGTDSRNVIAGGSCANAGQHIRSTGIYDSTGQNHPGKAGIAEFDATTGEMSIPLTSGTRLMWECPMAPGIYYPSQAACESVAPCRSGLGGSLVKCGGTMLHFMTADVKFPVQGDIHVSVVRWQPENPSAACAAAVAAHDAALLVHENRHRDDALAILKKAQASPSRPFIAYGPTEEAAKTTLLADIEEVTRVFLEQMQSDYDESVLAFHATEAGKSIPMDCGACP